MKELGLVSISFRNLTPEKILGEVKKAGLSVIEWGSDVHAPCNDTENLRKIARLQQEYGISCCSYGTYFRLGVNNTDELPDYITAAKILGTNIIRVWCGNKNPGEYSPDEEKVLFDECRKAAQICEKNNTVLCLECHNGTFTDTKEAAIRLMKEINSPFFRMYWQPNQFRTIEENKRYARLLSSFTKIIHVFNWTIDERFPLEDSADTWKEYLSYFDSDITLLLEFMPDDDINSLKTEAAGLMKLRE